MSRRPHPIAQLSGAGCAQFEEVGCDQGVQSPRCFESFRMILIVTRTHTCARACAHTPTTSVHPRARVQPNYIHTYRICMRELASLHSPHACPRVRAHTHAHQPHLYTRARAHTHTCQIYTHVRAHTSIRFEKAPAHAHTLKKPCTTYNDKSPFLFEGTTYPSEFAQLCV